MITSNDYLLWVSFLPFAISAGIFTWLLWPSQNKYHENKAATKINRSEINSNISEIKLISLKYRKEVKKLYEVNVVWLQGIKEGQTETWKQSVGLFLNQQEVRGWDIVQTFRVDEKLIVIFKSILKDE